MIKKLIRHIRKNTESLDKKKYYAERYRILRGLGLSRDEAAKFRVVSITKFQNILNEIKSSHHKNGFAPGPVGLDSRPVT